jgi:hypothetical protein
MTAHTRSQRAISVTALLVAAAIGVLAGFAAVLFWGYGPLLALLVAGLTVRVYASRGRQRELPVMVVGAGLVPVAILAPALLNTDPAIHYDPATIPALDIAALVLAVGIVWSGREFLRAPRG